MIYLGTINHKLSLITSSAAAIDVQANYIDSVLTTGAMSGGGPQNTSIALATTTDILAAPAASTLRSLKQVTIRNKDASLPCTITFQYNISGALTEIDKVTLAIGDCFVYMEGMSFFLRTSTAKLRARLRVLADLTFATAAVWADITGLSVGLKSGKPYSVEACLFHINNATTTGTQFGYNIGAAPTLALFGNSSAVTNSPTAGVIALGTTAVRDTAITAQTTGQVAIGRTDLSGLIIPSADGTFALRAASEVTVAAGLIVKAGSWMDVVETDN